MRIAYFTETFLPKVDGIVVKTTHLLNHLHLRGHDSILFSPQYRDMPIQYKGTKIHGKPSVTFPLYPELKIALPWSNVEAQIGIFQPDLIHLINPAAMGTAGLRAAKQLKIPVVASYHTDMPGFAKRWRMGFLSNSLYKYFRNIHNQCDVNFAPSDETIHQLEENGFERLHKWRGGVDIDLFASHQRSNEMRNRLTDGEPDKPLILFVSRLSKEKRPEMLLDVIKALPHARLAIVGDGPIRAEMERMFAGTPTVFTGYLQDEELAAAYASGDVFVFTGANETFGNVIIEAMSSALPVVAPNSGGLLDLMQEGETGFLYEMDDTASMIEAVRKLIEDPALAWRFGLNGRAIAETRSWERVLDDLLVDYKRVIKGELGTTSGTKTMPLVEELETADVAPELASDEAEEETETVTELEEAVEAEVEAATVPVSSFTKEALALLESKPEADATEETDGKITD